jgi:hypothetical protein
MLHFLNTTNFLFYVFILLNDSIVEYGDCRSDYIIHL